MAAVTMAVVGAATAIAGPIISGVKAKDKETAAIREKEGKERQLANLEANRQELINPYAGLTNEYANLGVATQAAEMQAEEADIALANTLDTMRATGAGAGGATALAQMALDSKKGIAASIEAQESSNEKLRAKGATDIATKKSEGEAWKWSRGEERETAKMERTAGQIDQAQQQAIDAEAAKTQALTSGISAVGQGLSAVSGMV